jgi:hypothetical protein
VNDSLAAQQRFGQGPLSRAAALIYNLLVIELLLLVTGVAPLMALLLLDRDASNLPLAAICAIPLGPACSAALYAWHHRRGDLTDLRPATVFRRGYRLNARPILRIWIPWLAWLTIMALNVAYFEATALPAWWLALLIAVAAAASLWMANALVITSLFTFRSRDTARLATHFLLRSHSVTLGNTGLLITAGAGTALWSEAAVALLAAGLLAALLRTCRPMISAIGRTFIDTEADTAPR